MKRLTISLLLLLVIVSAIAQTQRNLQQEHADFLNRAQQEYDAFKNRSEKEFNDFRDQANAEFAEYMRQAWEEFAAFKGIPVPKLPEPVAPPVIDPKKQPTSDPLPFEKIVPAPPRFVPPQPIAPVPQPVQPVKPTFSFSFYNTECKVQPLPVRKIRLSDLSEESVAEAWNQLSDSQYNSAIADCLELRRQLKLCDWAYIRLVGELAEKQYGQSSNEAVLFQMYVLTQSGYKVRIARAGNRLALLAPSRHTLYLYSYLNIDGLNYYVLDKSLKEQTFHVFNRAFPQERFISLQIPEQPKFKAEKTAVKTFVSKRYPAVKVSVSVNKNLMDFYDTYPHCEWNLYAAASIGEPLKTELYPALKSVIAGKSEAEAAAILLNFVQTAFEYRTDEEQFGYERSFFADETFFYPASDCEDRAILYSVLVRELLGLEAVLLHYPNHLATAVRFNETLPGDYLTIDGRRFLVCDPTYIGAGIGDAMEQFKQTPAKVVKIE